MPASGRDLACWRHTAFSGALREDRAAGLDIGRIPSSDFAVTVQQLQSASSAPRASSAARPPARESSPPWRPHKGPSVVRAPAAPALPPSGSILGLQGAAYAPAPAELAGLGAPGRGGEAQARERVAPRCVVRLSEARDADAGGGALRALPLPQRAPSLEPWRVADSQSRLASPESSYTGHDRGPAGPDAGLHAGTDAGTPPERPGSPVLSLEIEELFVRSRSSVRSPPSVAPPSPPFFPRARRARCMAPGRGGGADGAARRAWAG